jgi:Domain of unknown function (DUF1902)
LPGLAIEAEDMEMLLAKLKNMIPELLEPMAYEQSPLSGRVEDQITAHRQRGSQAGRSTENVLM